MKIKVPSDLGLGETTVTSQVFLSRRNLLMLLAKLDRVKAGDSSECTIVKCDTTNLKYKQTMKSIAVTAVEDNEYYAGRMPGIMHPIDEETIRRTYGKAPSQEEDYSQGE